MQKKIDFMKLLAEAKLRLPPYLTTLKLSTNVWILKLKEVIITQKECILKIAIPLLIILLGFYACNSSQKTISRNISDIFSISDDLRNNYINKPDYWGLSTEKAVNDALVSDKFIRNGKIILSGGEEVLVGNGFNADVIMPRTQTFDIVLKNLNKAQCISYVEAPISLENQVKILMISVLNDSGTYTFEWGKEPYKLPVSKYAAKDVCTTNGNIVAWSFQ